MSNNQTTHDDMTPIDRIEIVTGHLSDDARDELRTHIEMAAEGTPFTETDVIDVCFQLAYHGLSVTELRRAMHPIVEYAAAWTVSAADLTEYATAIVAIFGFDWREIEVPFEQTGAVVEDYPVAYEDVFQTVIRAGIGAAHADRSFESLLDDIGEQAQRGRYGAHAGRYLQDVYSKVAEVLAECDLDE